MDGWEQDIDVALNRLGLPGLDETAPDASAASASAISAMRRRLTPEEAKDLRLRQWLQSLLDRERAGGAVAPGNLAQALAALPALEQGGAAPATPAAVAPPQPEPPAPTGQQGGKGTAKGKPAEPPRRNDLGLLTPEFRRKLEALVAAMEKRGFDPVIYETVRTQARQDWLYGQGRTHDLKSPIVTWTHHSNHFGGNAADVISKSHGWNDPKFYPALKEEAVKLGLTDAEGKQAFSLEGCHVQYVPPPAKPAAGKPAPGKPGTQPPARRATPPAQTAPPAPAQPAVRPARPVPVAPARPLRSFPADVERWRPTVARYFPADQVDNALRVIQAESSGDPGKHNDNPATGDDSWGLFQINRYGRLAQSRPPASQLVLPEFNIQCAAQMYANEGWRPWTTARHMGLAPARRARRR